MTRTCERDELKKGIGMNKTELDQTKLVCPSENKSGKKQKYVHRERERDAERKSPGVSETTKTPGRGG